jgi:hypothetical protein
MGCDNSLPLSTKFEIEDTITDIIYKLKITNLTLGEYTEKLYDIFQNKSNLEEYTIKLNLSNIFYDISDKTNPYSLIHKEIFELFFLRIKDNFNINSIILASFPFLKKSENKGHKYYFAILKDIYSDKFSYNSLNLLFMRNFELFSYKLTKIIFTFTEDKELKKNCYYLMKDSYTYEKLEGRVINLLSPFNQEDKNLKNLKINDLIDYFEKKSVFHFKDIRDFIINGNFNK